MSGFDKQWLALREPEDCKARVASIMDRFVSIIEDAPPPATIVDIGSGTGSTYRTLSPRLPPHTGWRLVDYDAALLEEARSRIERSAHVNFHQQDLNHFDDALLAGANIVTASALFDLCSPAFCDVFIEKLTRRGIGLYAALNYSGIMEWSVPHALDRQVVEDFNAHQTRDKGFGPALGPAAATYLSQLFEAAGFQVMVGDSPWQMDANSAALQTAFLEGLKTPLTEIGNLGDAEIAEWIAFRLSHIGVENSVCIVGHTDLLAFPRD